MRARVSLEEFLNRVGGVCPRGKGYSAKCPSHDDQRQSLSIDAGRDGSLLLHCHAGCSFEEILRAAGLDRAATRGSLVSSGGSVPNRAPTRLPQRESAVYRYEDEAGSRLYEVVRFEPKDFRPRHYDSGGRVVWGLNGQRRVWYNLPAVLRARDEGELVIVVEGEKDCESLNGLGLVATTIAGGANAPVPHDTPRAFAGAHVVLIPDNDLPGRGFAERVGRSILPVATSVRLVDLPGLHLKGDVSDWLAAGGSPDELRSLIEEARSFTASGTIASGPSEETPGVDTARSPGCRVESVCLSDVRPEVVTWLWPGRVPWGKLTVLEGDPGVGKSTLALQIAAHVSSGRSLLPGTEALDPSTVLLLPSFEDGTADTVVPRLQAAGADCSRIHELRGVAYSGAAHSTPLSLPNDVEVLRDEIQSRGARLVLIDSLTTSLSAGTDPYKDMDVRKALAPLARVAEETGAAVVVIRHFTKSGRGNAVTAGGGSVAISGVARVVLQVHKAPDDDSKRVLAVAKCNVAVVSPSLQFSLDDAGTCARIRWEGESSHSADDLVALRVPDDGEREVTEEASDWLRVTLGVSVLPRSEVIELAKRAGYRERTVQRAAKQIGVKHKRGGFGAPGLWELPSSRESASDRPEQIGTPSVAPSTVSRATCAVPVGVARLKTLGATVSVGEDRGGQDECTTLTL
jgi:putative DNA primase/helicase